MAHIKEPKGVDFLIQSPPLTNDERKKISEFIRKSKSKRRIIKRKLATTKSPIKLKNIQHFV